MRISGGLAKGISLRVTKTKMLRPARDANRERLFSSLSDFVQKKFVLDLFAGTGSYGLEALSRRATSTVFVEKDRRIFTDLKLNFANTCRSAKLPSSVGQLENREVVEYLKHCDLSFDLIFLDPPYAEISKVAPLVLELIACETCSGKMECSFTNHPLRLKKTFPVGR